jgi:hypothetical protein
MVPDELAGGLSAYYSTLWSEDSNVIHWNIPRAVGEWPTQTSKDEMLEDTGDPSRILIHSLRVSWLGRWN